MKKIAILLSTYCGEAYLSELLMSLVSQSEKKFTLFIRDDISSDSTILTIQSYSKQLDMVFVEASSRLGPAKSFMNLLAVIPDSYEYFFFADQDDYWHPQKIERAVSMLSSQENQPSLYCSRLELVDADLKHLSYSNVPYNFELSNSLVENVATGCTLALNSQARTILLKNMPSNIVMHDWWAYVVISAFGVVLYDKNSYIKYRQHGSNVIGMESNFFIDYIGRAFRFFESNNVSSSAISLQAQEFFQCFSRYMSPDQRSLVLQIIEGKRSFLKRCSLIFFSKFRRQNFFGNCVLKFRFLINRY
ncbi:MAG: glycosyltransferase family 2 protein [Desulfomicrobium sp.]